jgi:hypothetical protein
VALITFPDKDNTSPEDQPVRQWRAIDANEVKNVVNKNAVKIWDNTLNKFPDVGGSGPGGAPVQLEKFIGSGQGNWIIMVDGFVEQVNDGTEFTAKEDNPGQDPAKWWVK